MATDPNPFTSPTNEAIKNAKLSRAQWLTVILYLAVLTFVVAYSFIPSVNAFVPLTKNDVRMAFWIGTIFALLLCIAWAIPDIIKSFKNDNNE